MKIKTKIRAAGETMQHNQTAPKTVIQRRTPRRPPGLKIKSQVRAAGMTLQHNETLASSSRS